MTTASDGSVDLEDIPMETQLSLKGGRASQYIAVSKNTGDDSIYRVFAPIVAGNRVSGAVEVVERLDTVSNIALQYLASLSWIAIVTILLMLTAFYLLFQSMVYKPLDKLLTAMEKAKSGNFEVAVLENEKPDEFGKLTNNFNSMMAQISEMSEERRRQNEILSEKVGEATSELQHKNEQLETANLELFRATRQMSEMERLAAAGQTAAQFAHEVGTPLNLISGHVQLLQTKLASESKEADRLQIINSQIERIEQIVRDMLDRTRFGAVELKPLNLNELLHKTIDTVEPTLQEKNVESDFGIIETIRAGNFRRCRPSSAGVFEFDKQRARRDAERRKTENLDFLQNRKSLRRIYRQRNRDEPRNERKNFSDAFLQPKNADAERDSVWSSSNKFCWNTTPK